MVNCFLPSFFTMTMMYYHSLFWSLSILVSALHGADVDGESCLLNWFRKLFGFQKQPQPPYSVLFTISSLNRGGTELRLVEVAQKLDPDLFRPVVFAAKGGELTADLPEAQLIVGNYQNSVLFSLPLLIGTLFRLRPVVLWAVSPGLISFVARVVAWLFNIPVVVFSLHGQNKPGPTMDRFNCAITKWTTDQVIAVSDFYRVQAINEGITEAITQVLYNGVNTGRFSPADVQLRDAAKANFLNMAPGQLLVGTVGNLRPVKAQAVLIRAAAIVVKAYPNARFVIVGEGQMRLALEQLIADFGLNDHVWLFGSSVEVPRLLQAMDVFVLTSDSESCPNTILEAMASGLPVVATRVGGVPELVTAETGLLVPPQDHKALATALLQLLEDPHLRQEMGRCGLVRVTESFTTAAMIRNREAFLIDMISKIAK